MKHVTGIQSEEEQALFDEAKALFGELFDDLNRKNLLRKTTSNERRRLLSVFDNTGRFQDAFNVMTKQYGKDRFAEFKRKTELSEETLIYSFLSQVFSTLLVCYESLIRLSLVFFLEEKCGVTKKDTFGTFLHKLADISRFIC